MRLVKTKNMLGHSIQLGSTIQYPKTRLGLQWRYGLATQQKVDQRFMLEVVANLEVVAPREQDPPTRIEGADVIPRGTKVTR